MLSCRNTSKLSINTTFVKWIVTNIYKKKKNENNYSPLEVDNKYTFHHLLHALYMYTVTQVSNALVTQNPNSTKLNTLCRCQTWLHDDLKPSILLISYICIWNPHGPNFDPVWIIYILNTSLLSYYVEAYFSISLSFCFLDSLSSSAFFIARALLESLSCQ